jgi:hypothetical protein
MSRVGRKSAIALLWGAGLLIIVGYMGIGLAHLRSVGSLSLTTNRAQPSTELGRELAVPHHLQDDDEYTMPLADLLKHGQRLFVAAWTTQDGGGHGQAVAAHQPTEQPTEQAIAQPTEVPTTTTTPAAPATASSCVSCHNAPYGIPGGGGEVTEQRAAPGLFGAGYVEMLTRQITSELQVIRNAIKPGQAQPLIAKGINFGILKRKADGSWDTTEVMGLPAASLQTTGSDAPPTLIIRPFRQAGTFVSLRQFTNDAFEHHHGIQSSERVGLDIDADGDGVVNELTRADMTAIVFYQATMAVPGRVIPNDPAIEQAIWNGEQQFNAIGCAACHLPQLPLTNQGWLYSEPNPYNPTDNLRPGEMPPIQVDLTDATLPMPRLQPVQGVVNVPVFTDFKLHDISNGTGEQFITRRLWGSANEPPYFHDGRFNTLREATLAHAGEATSARQAFAALSRTDQDALIEFLKSLQVLPPGTPTTVVDENGQPKNWPPATSP